jgi:hypothetical protein
VKQLVLIFSILAGSPSFSESFFSLSPPNSSVSLDYKSARPFVAPTVRAQLALIEYATDSDLSRTDRGSTLSEIREHYGNPAAFRRYIISVPPVYV